MDGEDQPATSQISEMDTPLDHAQEEAMPLVEWALTPMGHCKPMEEHTRVIAPTNHININCFVTGLSFNITKHTIKSHNKIAKQKEISKNKIKY